MQALILAAGLCTRLRPLTEDRHKCLIEVADGRTILDVELEILSERGITDIVITTGHQAGRIRDHVAEHFPQLRVRYVDNPLYATTNCIYSVWLARDQLSEDVLFLTGDLVFDRVVIDQLLAWPGESAMYVHPHAPLPTSGFRARIRGGRIVEIGTRVAGAEARFCWPLYRLSHAALRHWLDRIGSYVARGETQVYAEAAFNDVAERIDLRPAYVTDFCTEVDDPADLALARRHFASAAAHRP